MQMFYYVIAYMSKPENGNVRKNVEQINTENETENVLVFKND